jgi:hypothetical protein
MSLPFSQLSAKKIENMSMTKENTNLLKRLLKASYAEINRLQAGIGNFIETYEFSRFM